MESDTTYEPDLDTQVKDQMLEERIMLEEVTVHGRKVTRCKVHGLRFNGEKICSVCDYKKNPNCPVCGRELESPYQSFDSTMWEPDGTHRHCDTPTGGYWLEPKAV